MDETVGLAYYAEAKMMRKRFEVFQHRNNTKKTLQMTYSTYGILWYLIVSDCIWFVKIVGFFCILAHCVIGFIPTKVGKHPDSHLTNWQWFLCLIFNKLQLADVDTECISMLLPQVIPQETGGRECNWQYLCPGRTPSSNLSQSLGSSRPMEDAFMSGPFHQIHGIGEFKDMIQEHPKTLWPKPFGTSNPSSS